MPINTVNLLHHVCMIIDGPRLIRNVADLIKEYVETGHQYTRHRSPEHLLDNASACPRHNPDTQNTALLAPRHPTGLFASNEVRHPDIYGIGVVG